MYLFINMQEAICFILIVFFPFFVWKKGMVLFFVVPQPSPWGYETVHTISYLSQRKYD